ncbi:MAG: hypothetical protein IJH03_08085, partial [Clostridia bacterium]|nr:hypothetical protein [Clostridia bacterium]
EQGTGNRTGGCREHIENVRVEAALKDYLRVAATCRYRSQPIRLPWRQIAAATGLSGSLYCRFRRGNVPFVLAAIFRARLFLFPVDCSLFPLYYPLLFHQQLDKSVFAELNRHRSTAISGHLMVQYE